MVKVSELIEALSYMSPDTNVYFDDGDKYNGRLFDIVSVDVDSDGDARLLSWE